MDNFLIVLFICLIVGCAIAYVVKTKKKGVKCVGCPYAETCCHKAENGYCGCNINN